MSLNIGDEVLVDVRGSAFHHFKGNITSIDNGFEYARIGVKFTSFPSDRDTQFSHSILRNEHSYYFNSRELVKVGE